MHISESLKFLKICFSYNFGQENIPFLKESRLQYKFDMSARDCVLPVVLEHCVEAVGDCDDSALGQLSTDGALYHLVSGHVHRRRRLVQDHDLRLGQQSPGETQQLTLSNTVEQQHKCHDVDGSNMQLTLSNTAEQQHKCHDVDVSNLQLTLTDTAKQQYKCHDVDLSNLQLMLSNTAQEQYKCHELHLSDMQMQMQLFDTRHQ